MKKIMRAAFVKTLSVMAGYLVLGCGFGILAQKSGYGFGWVLAMSVLIYAGSMQFVAVSLLTGGASLLTAALTTLMVNARHLFYGVSMVEKYRGAGRKKPYLIFALTDETYSLTCTGDCPPGADFHTYCLCISALDHLYWVAGSVLGALIGQAISLNTAGIEFSMTALFITVFVDQWKSTKNHIPALAGVAASVLCLLVFGSESFLIPSMVLISLFLSMGRRFLEKEGA